MITNLSRLSLQPTQMGSQMIPQLGLSKSERQIGQSQRVIESHGEYTFRPKILKPLKSIDQRLVQTLNGAQKQLPINERGTLRQIISDLQKTPLNYEQQPDSVRKGNLRECRPPQSHELSEETLQAGFPLLNQNLDEINVRQYKTNLILQDKFRDWVYDQQLQSPEPNSKLVENTLETLGFRERLKFSKIKILNAKLFQKRAEIDKIQIRLKDQESIITRLAETVKRNSLIAQAGQQLVDLELLQELQQKASEEDVYQYGETKRKSSKKSLQKYLKHLDKPIEEIPKDKCVFRSVKPLRCRTKLHPTQEDEQKLILKLNLKQKKAHVQAIEKNIRQNLASLAVSRYNSAEIFGGAQSEQQIKARNTLMQRQELRKLKHAYSNSYQRRQLQQQLHSVTENHNKTEPDQQIPILPNYQEYVEHLLTNCLIEDYEPQYSESVMVSGRRLEMSGLVEQRELQTQRRQVKKVLNKERVGRV